MRKTNIHKTGRVNYELVSNSYIFCGQFEAPARTSNKNLVNFIDHGDY